MIFATRSRTRGHEWRSAAGRRLHAWTRSWTRDHPLRPCRGPRVPDRSRAGRAGHCHDDRHGRTGSGCSCITKVSTPEWRQAVRTGLDPSRGEPGQVAVPVEGVPAGGPQGGDAEDGETEESASLRHGVPGDGPGPGREAPFVVSGRTQATSLRWDIPEPACFRCVGGGTPADRKMPWYRVRQAPHGPGRHRNETTACLGGRAAPRCRTRWPRVSQRARSRRPAPS